MNKMCEEDAHNTHTQGHTPCFWDDPVFFDGSRRWIALCVTDLDFQLETGN